MALVALSKDSEPSLGIRLLADIKKWGFDGVELPLFDAEESLLKHTRREIESLGLESTAVCICTPETNPIDEEDLQDDLETSDRYIAVPHNNGA